MKTKLFIVIASLGFGLASCEKCSDCTCTGSIEFEFDEGISEENKSLIESEYTRDFEEDYPDQSETFCDNKQDEVDAQVSTWEAQTDAYDEIDNKIGGLNWSVFVDYPCTCVAQE